MKRRNIILSLALALTLTGCGHEHNFSEATCESPRICLECGEAEGEKLSHNWLEATCESPKKCSLCNITEGEPLEHQWLEATIESPKKCSICGLTEGEPLEVIEETEAPIQTNEDGATVITLDPETDYIEPTETSTSSDDELMGVDEMRESNRIAYEKGMIDKEEYDFMMEQLDILEADIIASESKPSTPSPSSSGIKPEVQAILDEMGATDGDPSKDYNGVQSLEGYGDPSLAGYRTN